MGTIQENYVSEHFKILLDKLELRHIRFHNLRHSCASLLLAKGIPMKAITSAFETKKEIEESDSSTSYEKLIFEN